MESDSKRSRNLAEASKCDVISGRLLARWKHKLEGNQRSVQTRRSLLPLLFLLLPLFLQRSSFVFRYLCASSSFALPVHCHIAFSECESFERTWRIDTAKTAGHFFSISTRELACFSNGGKRRLLSLRESIFLFFFLFFF